MIPDVELDTLEEFKTKLGEYANTKYLLAINLILTKRNFPDCFQFSNDYIAQISKIPIDIITAIDAIQFRPLRQFFQTEEKCKQCSKCSMNWRKAYGWTGIEMMAESLYPENAGCKVVDLEVGHIKIYTGGAASWMIKPESSVFNIIVFKKAENEFRAYVTGYPSIARYQIFTSTDDFMRFMFIMRFISSGINDSNLSFGSLMETDPHYKLIQQDDWKITPSLLWNNRIAAMEERINANMLSKSEAVKVVSEKFKEQIEAYESLSDFMDRYFPKLNVISLAAMCRAGEQPA